MEAQLEGIQGTSSNTEPEPEPEQRSVAECTVAAAAVSSSSSSSSGELPLRLRTETILRYDEATHPLKEILRSILLYPGHDQIRGKGHGLGGDPLDLQLDQLHTTADAQQWLQQNSAKPHQKGINLYDKRFKSINSMRDDAVLLRGRLMEAYHNFLVGVVAPYVGDPAGLVFEARPGFRCHLPGTGKPLLRQHCDAEYFHQPNEINLWLPLTPTFGSNTLWAELSPGGGDFRPIALGGAGEALLFYGNQCQHYTMANDTQSTRVSLDFRVIPRSLYRAVYPNSTRVSDGQPRFALGAHYDETGPLTAEQLASTPATSTLAESAAATLARTS